MKSSVFEKIKKVVNNPLVIVGYLINHVSFFNNLLNDKTVLKIKFWSSFNKRLNLNNPTSFNEKIQYLKLYDRKPIYSKMVDKYNVKEYVSSLIGEEFIIPTLGIWNKFEDINFDMLPNKFVLKCTHDSGSVIIVKNKNEIHYDDLKEHFDKLLKRDYYSISREWPYKNVIPRIICEEYIEDLIRGGDLPDYKIFCFNGVPKIIQVDYDRFSSHHRNMYDTNWNLLPFNYVYSPDGSRIQNKPEKIELMLEMSRKLSNKIPFIRCDFYYVNNNIYFGELTFFPESGFGLFNPNYYDSLFGELIDIKDVGK